MKVLFLHQFDLDLAGGSGTYLRMLARALADIGHDVQVVSARCPDRYACSTHALPFDFTLTFGPERRPGELSFDDFSAAELRALSAAAAGSIEHQTIGETRPDLLLVNHISLLADVASELLARHGIPYRIISYGTDTQLLLRDRRYVDWLGEAATVAERIFAISEFVASQVRTAFPNVTTDVLGGAVDHTVFRAGAPADPPDRVAFVGRLVTEKGIWTLLDAVAMLGDDVALDLIGEGPLFGTLEEVAARSCPAREISLLGYLPPHRLREALIRSAAVVVPSLWEEPLGLVVLEAMACGVPVVASRVGGIPEMVRHGDNGLLVEPGNAHDLAGAIGRILSDPALRLRLREGCLTATAIPSYADLARIAVA